MTRKQKVLKITGKLLCNMLYNNMPTLPNDAEIRGIKHHPFIDTIDLLIESNEFPETLEGAIPDFFEDWPNSLFKENDEN